MPEYINLKIGKGHLEDHVKRICRSNLKRPCKICTECPILGQAIEVMEEHKWKYNPLMEKPIEEFYSKYKK